MAGKCYGPSYGDVENASSYQVLSNVTLNVGFLGVGYPCRVKKRKGTEDSQGGQHVSREFVGESLWKLAGNCV